MVKFEDEFRAELLEVLVALKRDLQLYDLAVAPGPHEPGCECPRASCTLARRDEALDADNNSGGR